MSEMAVERVRKSEGAKDELTTTAVSRAADTLPRATPSSSQLAVSSSSSLRTMSYSPSSSGESA